MTEPRTFTLDDLFALNHLSDVAISPDGSQVAYVVGKSYTEDEHKRFASNIWLAETTGSAAPRQFTWGPHADSFPRWSPDGTLLAFLSDREKADTQQLYLMPANGGEARALTDAKGGVQSFKWSPDGKNIAFLAPDAESDEEEQRKRDHDDAQHVDHDYKFMRLWVVELDGEPRPITPPTHQVRSYAWHGNDAWAITTSPTPNADDFVHAWPVLRIRKGEEPEQIWQGRHAAHTLTSSADGSALAWIHAGASADGWVEEVWTLLPDGQPQRLIDDFDGHVFALQWLPTNDTLVLAAMSHTRSVVARVPLDTRTPETVLAGHTLLDQPGEAVSLSLSRDGQRYACLIEDGTHPVEVWVGMWGDAPQQRTNHNPHLADVALGASETLRWQAPDGLEIEGILIYPSDYQPGQRYPLVLHLHGGPNWYWLQRFMAGWHDWGQLLAARGYAVLLPNPRGSADRGNTFTGSNQRAWGTGDLDDVLAGVDHVIELGVADPQRLGVGGWSYGGFFTSWVTGHSDRFKAAIVGAGVVNLVSQQAADISSWLPTAQMLAAPWEDPDIYQRCSPITYVGNVATPTLVLHGAADQRVRLGQGLEWYHALRYRQVSAEMVIYPREDHPINERQHQRDLLTRVCDWFDRYL